MDWARAPSNKRPRTSKEDGESGANVAAKFNLGPFIISPGTNGANGARERREGSADGWMDGWFGWVREENRGESTQIQTDI